MSKEVDAGGRFDIFLDSELCIPTWNNSTVSYTTYTLRGF